jgi:membrane protein
MKINHGQKAERPIDIPKLGWKEVALRVKDQIQKDKIPIVSAGVAFYFFLSLFPALVALISIYGLVTDPTQVQQQMEQLTTVLPEQAREIITDRLEALASESGQALGWSAILSILISLYSANAGTKYLIEGLNIAYNEENERSFLKHNAVAMLFTLGGMVVGVICAAFVVGFPALVGKLGLPDILQTVISFSRWLILAGVIMASIAALYKFGPVRSNPKFRWASWGAVTAVVLWIGGSLLFSWYVKNFGSYNETYGPAAAVIILMLWFNLTSFVILLGAEINAELEHQTAKDTTTGEPRPMGERGAYYADRVVDEDEEERKSDEGNQGFDKAA